MESALRKSGDGCEVKEEKIRIESNCDIEDCKDKMVLEADVKVLQLGNRRKDHEDDSLRALSPHEKDLSCHKQDDEQLELAKAEMGEVREENQRLRMYLVQMMKDYQTLQQQFHETIQEEAKKSTLKMEEPELVSLSLGRNSSDPRKDDKYKSTPSKGEVREENKEGLVLGLDCKFESSLNPSPENSLEEVKEEAGQTWPPHKILKTMRSGDDEVSQLNPVKKARVSVRVRCDTPTMNDGCQWRKYGQKVAKGNPCPRAYYRCTIASSCPVRKQVQRCSEDMSILITTYEGKHNHLLPLSATTMASTTSAAASMLLSGSSTSGSSSYPSATTAAELHGLNFCISNNSKSNQFCLPNSLLSPSCPTITLDLTSNPSSSSSHLSKISTNFPPRYPSTNLNFSSLESNTSPISWTYGTQPYNNKNQIGSLNFGRQPQENIYQSFMQTSILSPTLQSILPDTIEAATKAITLDPSFQSALAAALTSIIGSGGGGGGDDGGAVGNYGVVDKFGELSNADKCTSSYLNKSLPTNEF